MLFTLMSLTKCNVVYVTEHMKTMYLLKVLLPGKFTHVVVVKVFGL